ncbi:MAG TPA: DUF559 domain-containing protein [Deinococcales bacterium]|nr:DUF559 domain-containing protein [Deinococcales bacterium]
MDLRALARDLRNRPTRTEDRFWYLIRRQALGVKFRWQFVIDAFIVDFACRPLKPIVELDVGQHFENPRDRERDERLSALGWKVLRYWDPEVFQNPRGLLDTLQAEIRARQEELGG